jgi:DUF1365 family protein
VSHSALYEGSIRHRRFAVRNREFSHRIAMAYVDLDELPRLLGGRLVRPRPGLVRFRRRDYFGDPAVPLSDAVRALVAERSGRAPEGPIRVLTHLRTLGHCFNPVSFYYCFAADGETLEAVVAEVTNTPWGERHAYVVGGELDKELRVSPFMPMDQRYTVRAPTPGETLSVHIESRQDGSVAFDATLGLKRRPLTRRSLLRPLAPTLRMLALIYGHAVALKLKGVPVQPHPA